MNVTNTDGNEKSDGETNLSMSTFEVVYCPFGLQSTNNKTPLATKCDAPIHERPRYKRSKGIEAGDSATRSASLTYTQ